MLRQRRQLSVFSYWSFGGIDRYPKGAAPFWGACNAFISLNPITGDVSLLCDTLQVLFHIALAPHIHL